MSRSIRRRGRIAALAASAALLLSGCEFSVYDLPLPGGADVGDDPYRITVKFRDVLDLVPQSSVKVDDITVGMVDDVQLDGYTAEVTVLLRRDVKLPDNAKAEIRQTSLLGEKFVSLKPPPANPKGELGDGDVIGLADSGNNPEVEEVLGALSLILNGGGVAQLKTITTELNKALTGREGTVKSVLRQLRSFMAQLDNGKAEIITAIERVNSLAISLNKETATLDLALEELPSAIASVDRQRDDLIRMLRALSDLSGVATDVIQASKAGTIESLNALAPTLTNLAKAGDDLPNSLQILLTFPFMDAIVGKDPAQARDLHMGDYTNLSIDLDINLTQGLPPGLPTDGLPDVCANIPEGTPLSELPEICRDLLGGLTGGLPEVPNPGVDVPDLLGKKNGKKNGGSGGGGGGGGGGGIPDLPGLGRAPVGDRAAGGSGDAPTGQEAHSVDTDLAAMLVWGVTPR